MDSELGFLSSFHLYRYTPLQVPLVTKWVLEELDRSSGIVFTSLDLGRSRAPVLVENGFLAIEDYRYSISELLDEIEYGDIYVLAGGKAGKLAFFRDGLYYKLYSVSGYDAPTLEISGIKMHRIIGITPWQDAFSKVKLARIQRGERVLDICTGLGYTAINSYKMGGQVVSIEASQAVLDIAKYNPWSRELSGIPIILGDAYEVARDLPRNFFDVIIHDPPRPALAGHLYGEDFYRVLIQLLRRGGRLVHYVGRPGHKRGIDFAGGVMKRLRRVGFRVRRDGYTQSIYAVKI